MLAEKHGMSEQTIADQLGVAKRTVNHYKNDKRVPSAESLIALSDLFSVSLDYLVAGRSDRASVDPISNTIHDSEDAKKRKICREVEMSSVSLMAAELSGGSGAVADDIALDHISFPTRWFRQHSVNPRNATLHRVRGKSMEPTIREGAIVLLDHDRTDPSIEGIYAFNRSEDGLRVKRLHRIRDHLIVMSDNRSDEYPTELLAREEMNEIRVLGRVAAVISEI